MMKLEDMERLGLILNDLKEAKPLFKCEVCGKTLKDGDTYALRTNRQTGEEANICFKCGLKTNTNKYEVITLEACEEE